MKKPVRARAVRRPGAMNPTEAEYAQMLENRRLAGEIQMWQFESIKLLLAPKLTYTPDFFVINADEQMELHEVKGFWRDDAKVKLKMAKEKFPFIFVVAQKVKKEWNIYEF